MGSDVIPLSIQLSRIVACEEYLQECYSIDLRWIENYLDYLSMSRSLTTYLLISWILDMSA